MKKKGKGNGSRIASVCVCVCVYKGILGWNKRLTTIWSRL